MLKYQHRIVLLILLITMPTIGRALSNIDSHRHKFGIILINDTLFKSDMDYTGSVGVYYQFKSYPLLLKYQIDAYTPSTKYKDLTKPPEGEHPYAGFGFVGTEYKILYDDFLLSLRLQMGATGNKSYAKDLQDIMHNSLKQSTFAGWDSQIQTKFGYVLNPQLEYIFNTKHFTLLPAMDIKIGNLLSTQTLGVQILSGINYNEDFLFTNFSRKPNYNIFILYKISNISKNVFLTGFEDYEYGVDIINTLSELNIGLNIQYKSYGITFQNHYQSKEYKSQKNSNRFSTLIIYYIF
jgi:lipid A 3-O-deacylase